MIAYEYHYYSRRAWEERLIALCQTPCMCLKPVVAYQVRLNFKANELSYTAY